MASSFVRVGPLASVVLAGFALGHPATLRAQAADTIAAVRDSTRPLTRIAPIIVTATRAPTREDHLGISTTVLTALDLRNRSPFQIYDALRAVPGSFFQEAAGPGGPTVIRLRGGEEFYTQVRVDGVEINQRGGFFDLRGWGLSGVERIEVSRGPQSALYGSSAVNGVVHFLTPAGEPGVQVVRAVMEAGAAGEHEETLGGSAGASGGSERLRYNVGGGGSWDRGIFAVPNDTWTGDGFARLDVVPSTRVHLTANGRFLRTASHLTVRDPGVTRAPLDPNARDHKDRILGSLGTVFRQSARWSHALTLSAFNEDGNYEDEKDGVSNPNFFLFDFDFSLRSDFWRSGAEWVSTYDARDRDGRGVALSFGARGEREDLHNDQGGDFGTSSGDFDRSSIAGFAELQSSVGERLDLLGGARLDRYEGVASEVSPRASAVFHLAPGRVDLRGAVGKSFKVANLETQFPANGAIASNPDLAPERAVSWEAGIDAFPHDDVETRLTWFQQTFTDLIRTVPVPGDTRSINRNLGESDARGVEWFVRYRGGSAWAVGSEGAWIDAKMVDNRGLAPDQYPNGQRLPFQADVRGSVFLEAVDLRRLSGVLRATLVGGQTVLSERYSGSRQPVDAYVVVDLSARYPLRDQLELFGRVENLLDREYATGYDRPGIPRRGALGLRFGGR